VVGLDSVDPDRPGVWVTGAHPPAHSFLIERLAIDNWPLAIGSWLFAIENWPLALGSWLLAINNWPLAIDNWLFAIGNWPLAISQKPNARRQVESLILCQQFFNS